MGYVIIVVALTSLCSGPFYLHIGTICFFFFFSNHHKQQSHFINLLFCLFDQFHLSGILQLAFFLQFLCFCNFMGLRVSLLAIN